MLHKGLFFIFRFLAALLLIALLAGAVMLIARAGTANSYAAGYAQGFAQGAAQGAMNDGASAAAPLPPGAPLAFAPYYAPHFGHPFGGFLLLPLLCLGGFFLLPLFFFAFRPPWRYPHAGHWGHALHGAWRSGPPPCWGAPGVGEPAAADPDAEAPDVNRQA
jgi:hypothetical protein